jgi:hypothetical protein
VPPKMNVMHEAPSSTWRRQPITRVEDRAVDACITYGHLTALDGFTYAHRGEVLPVFSDESFIPQASQIC